jgi:hypothetical protein
VSQRYVVEILPSALASLPRDETGRRLLRAMRALETGFNQLDIEQAGDDVWYFYPQEVRGWAILFTIAGGSNSVTIVTVIRVRRRPRRSESVGK